MARILVVDDEPTNAQVAATMCRAGGHEVAIAHNGRQALEALADDGFDLVLVDLMMPVMDGFEMVRTLRANPAWSGLPVIASTALMARSDRQEMLDAGVNAILTKPFTGRALREAIDGLLQGETP